MEKLYTLSSHPKAAITWWDLMDGAWQGAPAGLVRADLSPKPAYSRLLARIKGTWWTKQAVTDSHGEVHFRGFLGDFRVIVKTSGLRLERPFVLKQNTRNRLLVHVP